MNFVAKQSEGKQLNVNKGLKFEPGEEWKRLDMRAVGGGTIPTFTTNLKEVRKELAGELVEPFGTFAGVSTVQVISKSRCLNSLAFQILTSSRCSTRTTLPSSS